MISNFAEIVEDVTGVVFGLDALGELFADEARAFDGFQRVAAVFFDAGGDGQHEGIEEDVLIFEAVLYSQVADALGDGDLSLARARHRV